MYFGLGLLLGFLLLFLFLIFLLLLNREVSDHALEILVLFLLGKILWSGS